MANKTQITGIAPENFIANISHDTRRTDAQTLNTLFQNITGYTPKMWGPKIIGYGQYHYVYESGRQGDFLATGFSPRKSNLSIYIMPGYADFGEILADLGKHKIGKSCLTINKLADVDIDVLEKLIRAGLKDLATRWEITP
jgi:hypothetical protein